MPSHFTKWPKRGIIVHVKKKKKVLTGKLNLAYLSTGPPPSFSGN